MLGENEIVSIFGIKGTGKTTLCQKLQRVAPRVVIFDALHEYPESRDPRTWHVQSWDGFVAAIRQTLDQDVFRIVVKFDVEADSHSDLFDQMLRVLYYRGDVCIVVEEAWQFAPKAHLPKWLNRCILTGRHRDLSMIITAQRPATVHNSLISQSHHVLAGQLFLPHDLRALADFMGDAVHQLPRLKPHHFLHFSPGRPLRMITTARGKREKP